MNEKVIIFDAGSLISFSMNGLYDVLKKLKETFSGKFIITEEVKYEIIDRPMKIRRFELEALRLNQLFSEKVFELPESIGISTKEITEKTNSYMKIANETFEGGGRVIHLIDSGETSCVALSKILSEKGIENIVVIDERTLRSLVENPDQLKSHLQKRLHSKINSKEENYKLFKGVKIIRSTELIYIAYKKGLVNIKGKKILEALLYAMKMKGCSVSEDEIREIVSLGYSRIKEFK